MKGRGAIISTLAVVLAAVDFGACSRQQESQGSQFSGRSVREASFPSVAKNACNVS